MLGGRNGCRITCARAVEHTPAPPADVNSQKVKPSVHLPVSAEQWLSVRCFACWSNIER